MVSINDSGADDLWLYILGLWGGKKKKKEV